ncbi:MAG TPA: hypothetical protein VF690_05675 [Hymenobacter sp.]|jgi:hypothetical protein
MRKSSFYKRMTKYNLLFRNKQENYLPNEWIATSTGKEFAGQCLHLDEYLAVETRYGQTARLFLTGLLRVGLEPVDKPASTLVFLFRTVSVDSEAATSAELPLKTRLKRTRFVAPVGFGAVERAAGLLSAYHPEKAWD